VDVGADEPFLGRAAGLLAGLRQAALAEDEPGFLDVAVRLLERGLALIMPAPVASRSCLTSVAGISAI
jgi:hypothetical protein